MATPLRRDLTAQRNAPFAEVWSFTKDGAPVDFTGAVVTMQVRLYGAQPGDALISLVAGSPLTEGLSVSPGAVSAFIDETSLFLLPRGKPGSSVRFEYDIRVDLADRVNEVWAFGDFTVKSGVTDRLGIRVTEAGDIRITESGAVRVKE